MADRLAEVTGALLKKFGPGAVGQGQSLATKLVRIPTGSLDLDIALGGGFPLGRVTAFFGQKSAGKSTTAARIAARMQCLCRRCWRVAKNVEAVPPDEGADVVGEHARWTAKGECDCFAAGLWTCPPPDQDRAEKIGDYRARVAAWQEAMGSNSYEETVVAWVDPEDAFDPRWAVKLGLDPRRVFLGRSATGEESVDMTTALVGSTVVDLIVVDSLAHFVPRKEYEDTAEAWQQGLGARIVNKGVRKWIAGQIMAKRAGAEPSMIWINQVRDKITAFGDPTTKPHGKGQEFAASIELQFTKPKVEVIEEQYGAKDEKTAIPVRETFHFKVTKNRTAGTKGFTGSYTQVLRDTDTLKAGDIVEDEYVYKLVMHYIVVSQGAGSQKKLMIGDRAFSTQKAVLTALREEPEFWDAMRSQLMELILTRSG